MRIDGVAQLDGSGSRFFRMAMVGNGVDTYDFSNFTTDLPVDLRPGEGTDLHVGGNSFRADLGPNNGTAFNKGYAHKHALLYEDDRRSPIENAKGGSGQRLDDRQRRQQHAGPRRRQRPLHRHCR